MSAPLTAGDRCAAPRSTQRVAPPGPVRTVPDDDTGTATITLRFDTQMLARVDAASKQPGQPHRPTLIEGPNSLA
jgi:hypothetical protein